MTDKPFEVDGITYRPPLDAGVARMGSLITFCSGEDGGSHSDHLLPGQALIWNFEELDSSLPKEDYAIRRVYGV